jgi:hypothetical protein
MSLHFAYTRYTLDQTMNKWQDNDYAVEESPNLCQPIQVLRLKVFGVILLQGGLYLILVCA